MINKAREYFISTITTSMKMRVEDGEDREGESGIKIDAKADSVEGTCTIHFRVKDFERWNELLLKS